MLKATGILILRRQDGALLLQHRDKNKYIKYPNMWGSPGGHVKSNETYLECACRELFEETGLKTQLKSAGKLVYPEETFHLFTTQITKKGISKLKAGSDISKIVYIPP